MAGFLGWWTKPAENLSPGAPVDPHAQLSWFRRRWIALDQAANVWFVNGLPDETLSSHAGRRIRDGNPPAWARFVCWLTNKIEKGHCDGAIGR
jgi:hypothetical protein